jgi:hypothetical protein
MMSIRRTTLAAVGTLALTAGCGEVSDTGHERNSVDASTAPSTPAQDPTRSPTDDGAHEPNENRENPMQIQISIRDQTFTATLHDSAAADDLVAQLPVTVEMVDHGGVEKTGRLHAPLSLAGQPQGADPDVGDLGYYAPGNDLVLYYGDQSYFPGIILLGQLDGDAERIASFDGAVTATVEAR